MDPQAWNSGSWSPRFPLNLWDNPLVPGTRIENDLGTKFHRSTGSILGIVKLNGLKWYFVPPVVSSPASKTNRAFEDLRFIWWSMNQWRVVLFLLIIIFSLIHQLLQRSALPTFPDNAALIYEKYFAPSSINRCRHLTVKTSYAK